MGKLRVLDLFSGIGGFSLGLERTGGFETVAFCEIEEFPRRVLAKHWPNVPCYRDVRELNADTLRRDGIAIDVICGGFPCQDISTAGLGAGLDGARSGLWSEIARLAGELRPQFIIVENVAALLSRGLDRVLGDLAALGFDAEWHCIPASAVGAPHRRDRIWIVAYPNACLHPGELVAGRDTSSAGRSEGSDTRQGQTPYGERVRIEPSASREVLADTSSVDAQRLFPSEFDSEERQGPFAGQVGPRSNGLGWWEAEPNVGRVADGVPARVDRLKGLGNAIVPQIAELLGHAILQSERRAA